MTLPLVKPAKASSSSESRVIELCRPDFQLEDFSPEWKVSAPEEFSWPEVIVECTFRSELR